MKSKFVVLSLAGLLASLSLLAQTDSPTPAAAPAAQDPATNAAPAAAVAPAAPAAAPADATAAPAAPATPPAPAPADPSATPAAAPAAAAPEAATPVATPDATAASATTNAAPHDPNAPIPLIVMDEVPLTDAIKNLARQAGLNYMLDPKINYGAPGPDGHPIPQPVVSLRWENLTPDQALLAVLNNYNLVIVDDPKTKIARITIKDPAAPDPLVSAIIQLKYADPTNIVTTVQTALTDKRSRVVVDGRTAQLVLLATEKELADVNKLVALLDYPTKQVLIEAKLVETSKSPSTTKGIDWSGTVGAQHVVFGNGLTTGTTASTFGSSQGNTSGNLVGGAVGNSSAPFASATAPAGPGTSTGTTSGQNIIESLATSVGAGGLSLNTAKGFFPQTAFLNADGVSAVLSFINSDNDSRILSTPRAVTLDNEMATLSVTRAEPIFATTAGTQGSPGGATVSYTNVGTILRVTPHISANNTINLKVVPEVSDVGGTISKTINGFVNQADFFDVRRIETRVLIPSGNTLVMGGLVSDSTAVGNIKVPLLGDIPFLGALFRQESKTQDKKNLLIFITPTIVQSEDYQPTVTDFLKSKPPSDNTTDFGPWDSGKPQDWSKLMGKKQDASEPSAEPVFPDSK